EQTHREEKVMDLCPFSGQPCGNRKTTHVTELKGDGTFTELHLCRECSNKYMDMAPETCKPAQVVKIPVKSGEPAPLAPAPGPEPDPTPTPGGSVLAALLGALIGKTMLQKMPQPPQKKLPMKPPCPKCGHTIKDIGRT